MRPGTFGLVIALALGTIAVACDNPRGYDDDGKPDTAYPSNDWDVGDNSDWDTGIPTSPPPDKGSFAPFGPPEFGATVSADKSPPPLSGGTLAISRDDTLAIASDPDRDAVYIVDLATKTATTIALNAGDEPGRVVEDGAKRAHVVLRHGGGIATIDLTTKKLLERRAVCAAPRGIAYDPAPDAVHVACAGGELVTLAASTGGPARTLRLTRDLRDVLVIGDKLFVTTFRNAELIEVADGTIKTLRKSPDAHLSFTKTGPLRTHVAWRTVADPLGGIVMLHQRSVVGSIPTSSGGYASGSKCSPGVVQATATMFTTGTDLPKASAPIFAGVLSLDIAISPDGGKVAIVAAGNAKLKQPQIIVVERARLNAVVDDCVFPETMSATNGEIIAAAWTKTNELVYQSREPAMLVVGTAQIALSTVSRADTGHAIFHANSGAGIACASCHPEGGDDAHTWTFDSIGPRRTQTFRGGLTGTEPLHWDGDMKDINQIMSDVFVGRMSGIVLSTAQREALGKWVNAIPTVPHSPVTDAAAVSRGAALYADTTVGCSGCHNGKNLTNNTSVDVGTGKAFQVPSLRGIAWRAPFMHDGCAPTLLDRFGSCGGGDKHGKTSTLTEAQKKDLVAYLETL